VLEKWGDNPRIDWGYLYVAAPSQPGLSEAAVDRQAAIEAFLNRGEAPDSDDLSPWNALPRRSQVLANAFDLGEVSSNPVARHIVLAYDTTSCPSSISTGGSSLIGGEKGRRPAIR
jgi:hypothetical protein